MASGIVSTRGRGRRKTNATDDFKEKMEFLSKHFNPIAFPPPGKLLSVSAHEGLLKRIGLWDFVNLDFDETIREDLVKELVLGYRYRPNKFTGSSRVNGVGINLNRTAVGKALRLPARKDAKGSKGGAFLVSKDESSFLEKLIWDFMVLKDDADRASVMSQSYVLEFAKVLSENRFETADWAGLVWFMMRRELLRGLDLANCYYASHFQLVLKHQGGPKLFGDDNQGGAAVVGCIDENSGKGSAVVGVETGLNASILTKCSKRNRELFDEGEWLRKLQLGNDDQLMEDGNLEDVCLSNTVDSLKNKEKFLLNLKGNLNPDFSDCDIIVTEPGSSRSHTYNPLKSGAEIAEPKGTQRNDYVGMESMQVTQGHFQILMPVSCQRKNDVMEGKVTEASNATFVNGCCEEKDCVMKVKESEDAFEATTGGNLLGLKENVMEDKDIDSLREEVNMAQIDECCEKSDKEIQETFKHLEISEGNVDLLLQTSGMNGNASRSHDSLELFPFQTDMASYSSGIAAQHTDNMFRTSEDLDEECENMKAWTARFMDSARRKVEKKELSNSMLQKKIQDQKQVIQQYELRLQNERQEKQHYELMLQKERQRKHATDHRYNRELHLLQGVLEDYRTASKQTNSSFAKYRERIQLLEEPLYMPHPDGGGNVILVSEWKKLENERLEMAIKAMVEGFEAVWTASIEKQVGVLDFYCERLEGLEYDVKRISGSF